MKVFVVIQKDKPDSRVRGVFFTRKAAEKYIGPVNIKSMTQCDCCGQPIADPKYNPSDEWKSKLKIKEWPVLGEQE